MTYGEQFRHYNKFEADSRNAREEKEAAYRQKHAPEVIMGPPVEPKGATFDVHDLALDPVHQAAKAALATVPDGLTAAQACKAAIRATGYVVPLNERVRIAAFGWLAGIWYRLCRLVINPYVPGEPVYNTGWKYRLCSDLTHWFTTQDPAHPNWFIKHPRR